jgi:hypothetical protein
VTVNGGECKLLSMDVLRRPEWHGSPVHLGELFLVRKNHVEARCVVRSHQLGWELCLQLGLNRDFLQTKVCRTGAEVLATGDEWKAAMIAKGWQASSSSTGMKSD